MFDTRRDINANNPVPSPSYTTQRMDAETARRDYATNRGSTPVNTDTNPLYSGIADNFNQKQYGVKNATAQYKKGNNEETTSYTSFPQKRMQKGRGGVQKKIKNSEAFKTYKTEKNQRDNRVDSGAYTKKKKEVSAALLALHRTKAFPVAIWNTLWALKVWIVIQLPLATLSLIGLGFWYYIEYLKSLESLGSNDNGATWWERALSLIANVFPDLASAVLSLFGWDIPSIESLFFIAYGATLVFCYIIVILVLFSFLSTFSRPLSGKMAGLKWATLLISLIGYAIPGFNLLPWILLYIWVVALYPR
jgi:hypothetical protein